MLTAMSFVAVMISELPLRTAFRVVSGSMSSTKSSMISVSNGVASAVAV